MSYESARDAIVHPEILPVHKAEPPIAKRPTAKKDGCERWMTDPMKDCPNVGRFWVQRGSLNIKSCNKHLAGSVRDMHEVAAGWHGVSDHFEGVYVSHRDQIVIKMRSGDGWR